MKVFHNKELLEKLEVLEEQIQHTCNHVEIMQSQIEEIRQQRELTNQRLDSCEKIQNDLQKLIFELQDINTRRDQRMSQDDLTTTAIIEDIKALQESNEQRDQRMSKNDLMTNAIIEDIKALQESNEQRDHRMAGDDQTTTAIIADIEGFRRQILCINNWLKGLGAGISEAGQFNMLNKVSNSQAGEDCILAYVVAMLKIPFEKCSYLDLGANRPVEMSNTYFFYTHGARGCLVEANEKLIPNLRLYRSEDKIVNKCVAVKSGEKVRFNV